MATVELRGVSKCYPRVVAVVDLNLAVRERELLVLVGPSGCGKTTTLRLIAGLEPVSGGEIWIGGKRVNDWPARRRHVGLVPDTGGLYPHLTVYNNMAMNLKLRLLRGIPLPGFAMRCGSRLLRLNRVIDRRVKRTAGRLEITDLLDRRADQLSAGQRQRVALGRAAVVRPQVFLWDEPLTNLDVHLRRNVRTELRQWHQNLNTTTICVTHDRADALSLGDRIAVMNEGRIEQIGTPEELSARPASRFVADFFSEPAG